MDRTRLPNSIGLHSWQSNTFGNVAQLLAAPQPREQESGVSQDQQKLRTLPTSPKRSLEQMQLWETAECNESQVFHKTPFGQSMIIQLHSGHSLLLLWLHIYLLGLEISIVFVFMCNV